MKTITKHKMVGVVLVVLCLCSGHSMARANAGPPPAELWFTFKYYTSVESPALDGIQLAVCDTRTCEKLLYVQQYGVCDTEGCAVDLPDSGGYHFDCAQNYCRVISYDYYEYEFFKIIAQFSDRTRTSAPLGYLPSTSENHERAWTVEVQNADLTVSVNKDFVRPTARPLDPFYWSMGLTLAVEVSVAGAMLWALKSKERDFLAACLRMVFWINIVSYPLVWLVFPALGEFRHPDLQLIGPCVGIVVPVCAVALVWIYRASEEKRWNRIAIAFFSLLGVGICLAILLSILTFITGYGYRSEITLSGLSNERALLYAEASAVMLEWILLYVLNRKRLSLVLAGALSLAMNLASFLVGQMVW